MLSALALVVLAAIGALAMMGVFRTGAVRAHESPSGEPGEDRRGEVLLLAAMLAVVAGGILLLELVFCVGPNGESMCSRPPAAQTTAARVVSV